MKDRVRISVSGIRGEVPDALNVELASKFSSAFASYLEKGPIALCRDSRATSCMLEMAVMSSIMAGGIDGYDFGLIPTPCLQFLMGKGDFSGGVAVTGGHNPYSWNAILLLNSEGAYLEASEGSEVFNVYEAGDFMKAEWSGLGRIHEKKFPFDIYLEAMQKQVDLKRIREANFKVVADPCNGAVSGFLSLFADFFGLKLIRINDDITKVFSHLPEPSKENSSQAEAVVRATQADLGFLLNSDSSRISFVDEKGEGLSEEFTFPVCLLSLKGKIKKVVSTVVSSSLGDWAAAKAGAKIFRTKVGQSSVIHALEAEKAEAGGEGSGSFMIKNFSNGYDSLLSLVLVLDLMAKEQKSFSEIIKPFPKLYMKKVKIEVPAEKTYRVMDRLEEDYAAEAPDYTDGIRITRKGIWFNIRPSLTEFILRLTIEGETKEMVESVEDEIKERMRL